LAPKVLLLAQTGFGVEANILAWTSASASRQNSGLCEDQNVEAKDNILASTSALRAIFGPGASTSTMRPIFGPQPRH